MQTKVSKANTEIKDNIQEIEKYLEKTFQKESSGHDIDHLKRVRNIALKLQETEGGDRLIINIAALLHDVHRIIQKETGKYCTPKDSLVEVESIIRKCTDLDSHKINEILYCIEFHEEYDFSKEGKGKHNIETFILQDADNLDAIGAIGIGRTFAFGGNHGLPMWIPEQPFDRVNFNESENVDPSTIHHFYSKLLKLKGNMNTNTALTMAEKRHQYMENFLKEFFAEWNGEV